MNPLCRPRSGLGEYALATTDMRKDGSPMRWVSIAVSWIARIVIRLSSTRDEGV